MIKTRLQRLDFSFQVEALGVSVLNILRATSLVEHDHRGIDTAAYGSTMDAINEACAIARRPIVAAQPVQFVGEFSRQTIIGVESQDPICLDTCFLQREIPLRSMIVKRALKESGLWKRRDYFHRVVAAKTIDHDNV